MGANHDKPKNGLKKHGQQEPSIDTSIPIPPEASALADQAVKQARDMADAIAKHGEQEEGQGRDLIRNMLVLRETFEVDGVFNEAAFSAFADDRVGKVRGALKNPWQRLAKVCFPKRADASLVSKYGYVVAALVHRNIRSNTVKDELAKREKIDGKGRDYTGLDRFVRLHKRDVRSEGDSGKDQNPYEHWTRDRLAKNAQPFLNALYTHHLLKDDVGRIEDILAPEALAKSEADPS